MSRSRKKYPVSGHSCKKSEKLDKVMSHRKFRKRNRDLIKKEKEPLYKLQEISEVWSFQKDGRRNWEWHPYFINYTVSDDFIKKQYRK